MVNPHHVHKSIEMDVNSPSKNDPKDPKTIAGSVREGRYFYSYMPTGIYAEFLKNNEQKAIICLLGHYIYAERENYWLFFDNETDPVVCVWWLKKI